VINAFLGGKLDVDFFAKEEEVTAEEAGVVC
jgi:hypothetical protein